MGEILMGEVPEACGVDHFPGSVFVRDEASGVMLLRGPLDPRGRHDSSGSRFSTDEAFETLPLAPGSGLSSREVAGECAGCFRKR